jgi:hypothetical protein
MHGRLSTPSARIAGIVGLGALCVGVMGLSFYIPLVHDSIRLWRGGRDDAIRVLVPFVITGGLVMACGSMAMLLAWFGRSTALVVAGLGALVAVPHALMCVLLYASKT